MNIIICIGTINRPTFSKCFEQTKKIASLYNEIKDIVVIENIKPQSEWLNVMAEKSKKYDWCIQVDEDMYLYENSIYELLLIAKKIKKDNVLNIHGLLFDLFLKSKIGSLVMWNPDAINKYKFKDVLGCDRDIYARAVKDGYQSIHIPKLLGDHDSAPNEIISFNKYKEYTEKIKKFSSEKDAEHFIKNLELRLKKESNNKILQNAIKGARIGIKK